MTVGLSPKDVQRLEELELRIAQLSRQSDTYKRAAEAWYEKNRLLENAVRTAADEESDRTAQVRLNRLLSRVPAKPRKKWRWRG